MDKPTKAQIKVFLEWCGCKLLCLPEKDQYGRGIWETPSGLRIDQPDFTSLESLPFLFKYAVPKVESWRVVIYQNAAGGYSF